VESFRVNPVANNSHTTRGNPKLIMTSLREAETAMFPDAFLRVQRSSAESGGASVLVDIATARRDNDWDA